MKVHIPCNRIPLLFVFVLAMPLLFQQLAFGQGLGGSDGRIDEKVKFMPVPYLSYNRSLGFMAGGIPMIMFNPVEKDTVSPSSLIGGLGMYSTNKTWMAMGFSKLYFNRDNWRLTMAGGTGTVHYQFFLDFLSGIWIPYQAEASFVMVKVERRIYNKIYGGVSFNMAHIITSFENLPIRDTLDLQGFGLHLSMDHRNNPYYPTKGDLSNLIYHEFPQWMGNDTSSRKIDLDYNYYIPIRQDHDVLALRFFVGLGLGDLGFNQQYIIGGKDIRGYTQGAYRGNYLLSLQGEYRWNFLPRWGAVGFAGMATVFQAINKEDSGKLRPAIGTGVRFRVFEETNFSVGIDVARGIGDWGISFQIGEIF